MDNITYLQRPVNKSKQKKKMILIIAIIAVVLIAAGVASYFIYGMYKEKTMGITRAVGLVSVETNGSSDKVTRNVRIKSGSQVSTFGESLASVEIDETNFCTLEENTKATYFKEGTDYKVQLTAGGCFFEAKNAQTEGKKFTVESNFMSVNVDNCSGYLKIEGSKVNILVITNGKAIVDVKNPATGEAKTVEVPAGRKLKLSTEKGLDLNMSKVVEEHLPALAITFPARKYTP